MSTRWPVWEKLGRKGVIETYLTADEITPSELYDLRDPALQAERLAAQIDAKKREEAQRG